MSTKRHKKITKQVRVDSFWHKMLKIKATNRDTSMTALLEEMIEDGLGFGKSTNKHGQKDTKSL